MSAHSDPRLRELARIHILRDQAALDDVAYRATIWAIGRVRSAADLDAYQRRRLIRNLANRVVHRPGDRHWVTPRIQLSESAEKMGRKVCALLAAAEREHPYADAIARKMRGVDRWEFLASDDLHRLIAALQIDQRRQRAR